MRHPQRVGRLGPGAAVGQAGSASCGDVVRIELIIDDGFIGAVRFQAFGCPATIAGAAEVAERVEGVAVLEAARVSNDDIADTLHLSRRKRGCSNLAADALHDALQDAARRGMRLSSAGGPVDDTGVLVAMSGGIDSSMAALLLLRQGVRVVGVTFRLWSDPACGRSNTCCSPATIRRARRVAHRLGVPHFTIDLSGPFHRRVVQPFVDEYAAARTPNPCVRCNADLRFEELASLADRLGLGRVATGHYADLRAEHPRLGRARDRSKDQSYVLAQVDPSLLGRLELPLAGLTKSQVRGLAREAGLEPRGYKESQEICFIPDNDHVRFLRERLGSDPGTIVDAGGRVLGRHTGLYGYTVGQRKGLGIAAPEPLYVVALRPTPNQVVVGSADELAAEHVVVTDLVRHVHPLPASADAQLRSSGGIARVGIEDRGESVVLHPVAPLRAVAPGQAAVLYADDRVVAAGTIQAPRNP